ncbi:lipopolysaccharide biosynthesis protein [Catenovulum maritimum]|uniref:Lipopolysaccharide biosynthesis protein n=2 Tax=Catenovulum maritimum TaxID=1513271 RepID=A0A0J8GVU1_9ALTE|nr:lipopolysaccharide biosynthesis protein [Catenovulum maritimum]
MANGIDSDFAYQSADDEIDLRELWSIIWAGRIKIIAITAIFAIASVIYALSLPNMYKSEMILAPAQTDNKGGMGALAAQYGGLAAMAGINLGGGDNSRIDQAVELMKSWPFLEAFWQQHNLKPQIMAVKGWDKKNNRLIYDTDIYNPETKAWAMEVDEGEEPEPTSYETYKELSKMLSISHDAKSGMLTIAIEHYSPPIAFKWVGLLKEEINSFYQQQDMQEAHKNINYLKAKIAETNITEMQSVFYNMIESQTKTLMLAEVSEQYLIKTIVPAKVPEKKSKPKRALFCVLGVMLGGMFSIAFVLVRHFVKNIE